MESDVSITLTGPPDRIQAVLDFWRGGDGTSGVAVPEGGKPPAAPGVLAELDREALAPFVRGLSVPASVVVHHLARDAARGLRVPIADLLEMEELGSLPELNGFMGGVGRVWARLFTVPNPFIRTSDPATDESFYELDLEFARKLLAVFDERSRHFGRWTARAREALTLAHAEAGALSHGAIGTEHLFLGILREGDGAAARALKERGVTIEDAREAVRTLSQHQGPAPGGELALTPRLRRLLSDDSIAHARRMNDTHISVEHLLLGLLDATDGTVAKVLATLEITAGEVRGPIMGRHLVSRGSKDIEAAGTRHAIGLAGAKTAATNEPIPQAIPELSPREHEVLDLIARGYANNEIGEALSISTVTVARHVTNIFKQLGVENRTGAIRIARRAGLGE